MDVLLQMDTIGIGSALEPWLDRVTAGRDPSVVSGDGVHIVFLADGVFSSAALPKPRLEIDVQSRKSPVPGRIRCLVDQLLDPVGEASCKSRPSHVGARCVRRRSRSSRMFVAKQWPTLLFDRTRQRPGSRCGLPVRSAMVEAPSASSPTMNQSTRPKSPGAAKGKQDPAEHRPVWWRRRAAELVARFRTASRAHRNTFCTSVTAIPATPSIAMQTKWSMLASIEDCRNNCRAISSVASGVACAVPTTCDNNSCR